MVHSTMTTVMTAKNLILFSPNIVKESQTLLSAEYRVRTGLKSS